MYIDIHTHLTDQRYKGRAQDIIQKFKRDNIKFIINVGYNRESSDGSVELAQKNDNVYAAVGIHPNDCKNAKEKDYKAFKEYARNPKVAAIGETGLDYHYEDSPSPAEQKHAFIRHMQIARDAGLPIIIHLRDAYSDMYDILRANRELLPYGAVMHCFSGSAEMAKRYLNLGMYISFAGPVTFSNARGIVDSIKAVPLDRILTETDCPYLTPEPYRGELNYPSYVKFVADKIAEISGVDIEKFNNIVEQNALRLFSRIKPL